MTGAKRILASLMVTFSAAGLFNGCSRLTDPTYEFLTLLEVDGKPLPVFVRFGPDSSEFPIASGRLGFPDASLGLPCRLLIQLGSQTFPATASREASGSALDAQCVQGVGTDKLIVTAGVSFFGSLYRVSGAHSFTFGGPRIRGK